MPYVTTKFKGRKPLTQYVRTYKEADELKRFVGRGGKTTIEGRGRRKVRRQVGFNPMSMLRRL